MPTLTYWVCRTKSDSRHYNIRAKTKKDAMLEREVMGANGYEEAEKVSVYYKDSFSLMYDCLNEGGGSWE